MTHENIKAKINALNNNEEFVAKLKACETAEAIAELYASEDIEIAAEDIEAAVVAMNNSDKEFSEEDLDNVAGGIFVSGGVFLAYCIVYSCVVIQSAYTLRKLNKKK